MQTSRTGQGVKRTRVQRSSLGQEVPRYNLVAKDQLWKSYVEREENSAKMWKQRWGFLSIPWQELMKEELAEMNVSPSSRTPEITAEIQCESANPSPPVPRTSSAMIGWRASDYRYNLELYGRCYARPFTRLEEKLRQPLDSGDDDLQNA